LDIEDYEETELLLFIDLRIDLKFYLAYLIY